jgi:hypothetical protein
MKPRTNPLSLREQAAWMRTHLPHFVCTVTANELVCRGTVQPTPLGHHYRAVIVYVGGRRPRVFLPGGQIRRRNPEEPIPHTYSDEEPCLFYPNSSEWKSDMKLATSVVGWLIFWLHYYEIWLATGEWLGGGIDHGERKVAAHDQSHA